MLPPKVLIIDDERGARESLRTLLEVDYSVYAASNASEAIKMLRAERPDLVISDVRMPDRSGLELLGDIKKIDQDVAVVMVTGFGDVETASQALRNAASDFVVKPYDVDYMLEVVKRHIENTLRRRSERALADERARLAVLGQLASEFTHDLSNALTVLHSSCDLMTRYLTLARDEHPSTNLDSAARQLDVLQKTLTRCLAMSHRWREGGNRGAMQLIPADLRGPVAELVRAQEQSLPANQTLEVELGADRIFVALDAVQFSRALQNLITNALQALPPAGGTVKVSCHAFPEKHEAIVKVVDNGIGIPADQLDRIFQPYFTTKGAEGLGLGLFVTEQIICAHGGKIHVSSTPGAGTTFSIALPLLL